MIIEHQADLSLYTTMGVQAEARTLVTVESVGELQQALVDYPDARVLGGGSNVLVQGDVGVVLRIAIAGLDVTSEDERSICVQVGGGMRWHDFVTWAVMHDYGGIENLAMIPGTVGAAPIQNIGAYGIEQNAALESLHAVERSTGVVKKFTNAECEFGYRTSVFKTWLSGQYVITDVTYRLTKPPHTVHAAYKDIAERLGDGASNIREVYETVIGIRSAKLPDPKEVGNAGSFFKNPVITVSTFDALRALHGDIPSYTAGDGLVKIPAAWLIDQAGWKGHRRGNVGVHPRQALVLVNYGNGTGEEILELAEEIQRSVADCYGVELELEVNVWR